MSAEANGNGNGNGRVHLSEDTLRRLLAEFKVELIEELKKYATQAALEALELRVRALELRDASRDGAHVGGTTAWAAIVAALAATVSLLVILKHVGVI